MSVPRITRWFVLPQRSTSLSALVLILLTLNFVFPATAAEDAAVAEVPDPEPRPQLSSSRDSKDSAERSKPEADTKPKKRVKSSDQIVRESTGFDIVPARRVPLAKPSDHVAAAMVAIRGARLQIKFGLSEFGNLAAFDAAIERLAVATEALGDAGKGAPSDEATVRALHQTVESLSREIAELRDVARQTLAGRFPLIRGFGLELVEDEELQIHSYPLPGVARRIALSNALTKLVKAGPSDPFHVLVLFRRTGDGERDESFATLVESEAQQAFSAAPHFLLYPRDLRKSFDAIPAWDAPDDKFDPICRTFLRQIGRDETSRGVMVVMLREFQEAAAGDIWVQTQLRSYGASTLAKAEDDPEELEADKVRVTEGLAHDKSRLSAGIVGGIALLLLASLAIHAGVLRRTSSYLRGWQNLVAIPVAGFVVGLVVAPCTVYALGSTLPNPRTDVWLGAWWPCTTGALTLILPAGVFRLAAGSLGRYVPAMSCHGRWGISFVPVAHGGSGSWMWAACYALNGPCVPLVIANATAGATIAYVFGRAIDLADEFPAGLSPVVLVLALLYGAAAFLGSAPGLFVVAGIAGVTTAVHWVVVRRRSAVLLLPEGAAPLFEGGGQSTPRTLEQLAAALRSPMYQPPAEFEVLRAAFLPHNVEGSLWVGLVGPTAAGKTAAARHLIRELHSTHKDLKVLSGRCSKDSAPYQAFREALADVGVPSAFIAARMQGGGMTGMFDRLADEIIPFWDFFSGYRDDEDEEDDEANRGELFAAVTNALHTLAQKHRVVLFLDDVQWIDEGSAALLKHLKENFTPPADSPPIILLGGRDAATMERLGMEEAIHRISPPSSADQVRILEGSLGIERGSARRLVQAMGVLGDQAGGMFWLIRAVQELISNDGLVTTSRGFTLKKQYLKHGQLPVPAAMRTSLAEALRASAEYRPVLECAALLGEEFRVEDVADCLKMDRLELLQILRHLDQELHLVRDLPHDQECYAFSSAFVLDIVREDLGIGGSSNRPPSKIARELHARIGQVLECRTPRTAELVFRIARHFSRAGASWSERAVEHCRAAARIARLKRDFKEARRFLSMAENSSRRARRPLNLRHERLLVDAAEAHASGRNVVQAAEAVLLSIRQEEHSDRDLLSTAAILCRDAAKETGDVRWSEQLRVLERRIHAQSQKT